MGSARWALEGTVQAPPDAVWAWMTDFRADDHTSEAYRRGAGVEPGKREKPAVRTILSREGNVLRIRDEWDGRTFTSKVTLDPAARTVRIEGGMGYDAKWTAEAAGSSTRVRVEGRMGKGLLGALFALLEGPIRRGMERDFRGHMEELRESLGGRQGSNARPGDGAPPP